MLHWRRSTSTVYHLTGRNSLVRCQLAIAKWVGALFSIDDHELASLRNSPLLHNLNLNLGH